MIAQPAASRGISVAEAAQRLDCDASTIRRMVRRGELTAWRIGVRTYVLDAASVAGATVRPEGRPPKERP